MRKFKKFVPKNKIENPIKKFIKSFFNLIGIFILGIVVGLFLLYIGVFNMPATYIARFSDFSDVKKSNLEFAMVVVEKDAYVKGHIK